ncbi:MAG: hypothetical protein J7M25_07800 [Deltaproteobacteria bacterium]|nr:hypothetical protein [Deltaproteobacteria bacterium]
MVPTRILLLERNKLHLRKLTRVLTCTGVEVIPMEDKSELSLHLDDQPAVLCADAVDLSSVVAILDARQDIRAVVWTASQDRAVLERALDHPRLSHILGRASPDVPPREWEILWTVRRMITGERPSLASLLHWGYTGFKETVRTPRDRDLCVEGVVRFCERLNTPGRVREMLGEFAHELLMNAMYDAPVDAAGQPKYAHDRKAQIELSDDEAAVIRCASDGTKILISVVDRFGRLPRDKVFSGMLRGLDGGIMDKSYGGAGLGMVYVYKASVVSIFDVEPGKRTEVTGIYELDLNQRIFRTLPRSVHVFIG